MSQKKPAFKFAVCVNNADYPASLELHKIYRVIPDEDAASDGDLCVIDESGVTLEGVKDVNAKINALVDSQIRTDESLRNLVDIVDRYYSDSRNGV